ncbi:hypothetical protein NQ314_008163 [Rhamnusium bicolor]|uniref:PiggyBac transposable element-derived protein domain-containing protein n=1 Tax=Rhamnusium bicolor TaxID=1586634 RepID=A0AAV8YDD8_9CUCU|nr:hypothetical protein NQ314_008163 [Rhamnusium bicolor]
MLLSTTHVDDKIDPESEKPMMIVDYNSTKYGVDVVDQMCASYSIARNSRRWPLTVFFNIMIIGGINAPVIYQLNNRNNSIVRREFLRTLALNLLKPYVNRRYYLQSIPRQLNSADLVLALKKLQLPQPTIPMNQSKEKQKVVMGDAIYVHERRISVLETSVLCYKWVCQEHQKIVPLSCVNCAKEDSFFCS